MFPPRVSFGPVFSYRIGNWLIFYDLNPDFIVNEFEPVN